jgi:UDP-GlcNAc:undecaprenyl-phosphate GlcNAc-1-phosphate transferase
MENRLWVWAVSFLTVLILTPLAIKLARRFDFLDYPKEHKSHQRPTPLLGGTVVFTGLSLGLGLALSLGWIELSQTLIGFYLASGLILILGLVDDKLGLSPFRKLVGQVAAALVFLSFYDPSVTGFGFPLGFFLLLFWLVGLVNALNFLDNMDGLCSGLSLIASLAFAVLAFIEQQTLLLVLSLSLAGSYLAFLKYNLSPAKIFLGDAGSLLSGFALAALGLAFVSEARTQYAVIVPILILSYPIFDISFVTLTRLKQGKKFYQGGLDHSSHRLVYLGVTSQRAVGGILLISLFLAATGVLTFYVFDSPVRVLIPLSWAFALTIFGIHLHRNFVHFKEKLLLIAFDIILVNLSLLMSWQIFFNLGQSSLRVAGLPLDLSTLAILSSFFWVNLFAVAGLYEFYWGILIKEELKALAKTVLGGGLILFLLGGRQILISVEFTLGFALYILTLLATLILYRSLFILMHRKLSKTGKLRYPAVIVGTEQNAQLAWQELSTQSKLPFEITGFIDENHGSGKHQLSQPIVGRVENLEETLRQNRVREVLIAVEPNWPGSLSEVLETTRNLEVNFRIRDNLLGRVRGRKIVPLAENSFYKVYPSQMRTWEWGAKRLTDLAVSAGITFIASPILAVIYLWLKLKQEQSPLESFEIIGRKGNLAKVYCFNSSLKDSIWRYIPALFSVLKGDLSLIGPGWVKVEKNQDPRLLYSVFEEKLKVRPGLIRPAFDGSRIQDHGDKNPVCSADLEYVERMSFTSDLGVLLKTIARPLTKLIF